MNLFEYPQILGQVLDAGYAFKRYDPFSFKSGMPVIFLRHDIDLGLDLALELAEVDRSSIVQSTFFILSDCPFYDIASTESIKAVNELFKMGHDIALHVDFSPVVNIKLKLEAELRKLKRLFPFLRTDIFSIHRPGRLRTWERLDFGLTNVSNTHLFGHQVAYLSDSTGKWNENGPPLSSDAFLSRLAVQLIIHPVWWVSEGPSPVDKLVNLATQRNWRMDTLRSYLPAVFAGVGLNVGKLMDDTGLEKSIPSMEACDTRVG